MNASAPPPPPVPEFIKSSAPPPPPLPGFITTTLHHRLHFRDSLLLLPTPPMPGMLQPGKVKELGTLFKEKHKQEPQKASPKPKPTSSHQSGPKQTQTNALGQVGKH